MADKAPKGMGKFKALARKVIAVPKDKVDAKIAQKRAESPRNPQKP